MNESEKIIIGKADRATCSHKNYIECEDTRDGSIKYICKDCGFISKNKCEVYTRVVGYLRPVEAWNRGKQSEYHERMPYKVTN